jgi:hypothetical protein
MKKSLFLGVLALTLLVIPGAVSAYNWVNIYGQVPTMLEVDVYPYYIYYGTMDVGFHENFVTVTVNAHDVPWSVTAADLAEMKPISEKGYMNATYPMGGKLMNPIRLATCGGGACPYTDLSAGDYTDFMAGTTTGPFQQDAYFNQTIVRGDTAASYSITVTFTGIL